MDEKDNYRHEFKYLVTATQIEVLKTCLKGMVPLDPHAGENGKYCIRSMYFDDYYNRCFYENENGIDPREKFRIRIYNYSDQRISLECKRKERGKTHKEAVVLTKEQAEVLLSGGHFTDVSELPPLLRKFNTEIICHGMQPKVIVEYERIPYVYQFGNVRITFDTNLASSTELDKFFVPNIAKRPVMPTALHLLEVKWDDYLPDPIKHILCLDNLQQTAYSKYYLCRKYDM